MKHDPNGPSRLNQREHCPGSFRLETSAPQDPAGFDIPLQDPDEESEHSRRGRFLHEVIANCIADLTPPREDMLVYSSKRQNGDLIEEDYTDSYEALMLCWGWAMERIGTHPIDGDNPLILIEWRVDLTDFGIGGGGTVDLAIVWPGLRFDLTDWKFGFVATADPIVNRQMQAYAAALANNYGCHEGHVSIVQPHGLGVREIRTDYYDPPLVARIGSEIRNIVEQTQREDAPLIPGDHCRWCRVQNACPARKAQAEAIIARKPTPILHTVAALPAKDRAPYIERMKLARSWLDGALAELDSAIIDNRLVVPGFVVAEGRKSREWLSEHHAVEAMHEAGLSETMMYERKMISPAKAEKAVGKARATRLRNVIVSSPGKPRVVREGTTGAIDE